VDFAGTATSANGRVRQGYHYFPLKSRGIKQWYDFGNHGFADARRVLASKSAELTADLAILTEPLQWAEWGERVYCAHTKNIEKDPLGMNVCLGDGHVNFCMDEELLDYEGKFWVTGGPLTSWPLFGEFWEGLR